MSSLAVNVICRNYHEDRVIPRFSSYLADGLGWHVTARPDPDADVIYMSGYFESQLLKPWPKCPTMAYFTHREVEPKGNGKAKLYDAIAQRVSLRIATAAMYAEPLSEVGPTTQVAPPVERGRFVIPKGHTGLVCGFSGYTYSNKRKGEDMARRLIESKAGRRAEWRASGRGWPVPTKRYPWKEMPGFYGSLDVLVVTSRVEGVPMPPLECLSCGVSVVVPRGVGLLDELPDMAGIHRYKRGDAKDCVRALEEALAQRGAVDRKALRAVTEPYSVTAWCEQHRQALEDVLLWKDIEEPAYE